MSTTHIKYLFIASTVLLINFGCTNKKNKENIKDDTPFTSSLIETIEEAHKKDQFLKKQLVEFDIDIDFRGNDRLDAHFILYPNSSKIRIEKTDGSSLIFDGQQVYLTPETANTAGARFDMFTWAYFFALPYKLDDPGTKWENLGNTVLFNQAFQTAKLSFEKNIGDSPDDWYVLYSNMSSGLLEIAGYIVTFGNQEVKKAEEDPHAIQYSNYVTIEGIPIATKWDFFEWTLEGGISNKIGEATISNIKFTSADKSFFEKPANVKSILLE